MVHKYLLKTILWVIIFAIGLFAGDLSKVGTVGGTQLLIPIGAKSIASGGAVVANVTGAEAIYWNPAGIVKVNNAEVMFNNMNYIADIELNYLAAVLSMNAMGTLGFSLQSLNFGDIEETTVELPDGTGRVYSPTFVVASLSYGRYLTDRVIFGATGKYIFESIMQTKASTLAFDLGIQYKFKEGLYLGVTMKNVGGKLRYDGRNLENQYPLPGKDIDVDEGYFRSIALPVDLPSLFSFGIAYERPIGEKNNIRLSSSFSNLNEGSDVLYGGIEYSFNNMFFLRGGYSRDVQTPMEDQLFGFTLGAGMVYNVGGFNIKLDYAFRQITQYFNPNNIFTLKIEL